MIPEQGESCAHYQIENRPGKTGPLPKYPQMGRKPAKPASCKNSLIVRQFTAAR